MADSATIKVTIDDAAVQEMLASAPDVVQKTIRELVEGSAIDVQREMRIAAPIAVTGDLRRSVRYTFTPATLSAEITPAIDYAGDVEYGGKARYVSVAEGTPLRAWAEQKGINPYALRNSIAKKGTKAHPFVEPTYIKMKPVVEESISSGITEMVEGLNR